MACGPCGHARRRDVDLSQSRAGQARDSRGVALSPDKAVCDRVAQYAGDPGVLGIIRIVIVIYLFHYPYFIMTPGPCSLRTTTSEDDNL